MKEITLVVAGGFVGAVLRHLIGLWANRRLPTAVPVGTFAVNMAGSFAVGVLAGFHVATQWAMLLGVGFLGAFTTFSTFNLEVVRMWEQGRRRAAALYVAASYGTGVALAALGWAAGASFGGA